MDIYSSKQRWKIALILVSLTIIVASLFVSNQMIDKIAQREKAKAEQWADAIRKKVELVKLTNQIFDELRAKERQKIQIVVDAQRTILNPSDLNMNQDIDFALNIIASNKDIPVVILTDDGKFAQSKNVDSSLTEEEKMASFQEWIAEGRSYEIEVFGGIKMQFVYGESNELIRLEKASDSLINSFNSDLIDNSSLIPVILVDEKTGNIEASNLPNKELKNPKLIIAEFEKQNAPIKIDFGTGVKFLYFKESPELKQLTWFPYIQFSVIGLIVVIGYLMFSTFRKAEQNQVWAGMAKETAHQLGTPLSSMMAWVAHLEAKGGNQMIVTEMTKDLDRLEKITDRFSKIGSGAKLVEADLVVTIGNNLEYLRARLSDKIIIDFKVKEEGPIVMMHNPSLMEWVVENICKNAVDAMGGKGQLTIELQRVPERVYIDITDTGKGLTPKQFKTIFQPGYSTKKRGWGLGLTLVKRIIEEYHKGKVFVLKSEIDKGTTIRISIPL
ncbi:MAG: HAMP domain-containing histidine kinase [Bacteroidetes bacterium]|nr:HAMP domain-containing histidine kinase [Bacteroidota bacterium]